MTEKLKICERNFLSDSNVFTPQKKPFTDKCWNSAASCEKSIVKVSLEMVRLAGNSGQNMDFKPPGNPKIKTWGSPVWSQAAGCIPDARDQLHWQRRTTRPQFPFMQKPAGDAQFFTLPLLF